ncbi:PA14 domain-containing protein [uncultured Hymenobacter sp.]|uniref:PA14 domain-containing protein n=1 Tax=uncultured Hymenobacter sp. TaxID=170016 RepID=UPI0035CC21A9
MKHFSQKLLRLTWLWLALSSLPALAQTTVPSTADDYIRPYTENFQYGCNIGFYGYGWNDETLAAAGQKTGVHSLRPTLPESFVEYYGYNIRRATFTKYVNELGMKEITCFIEKPSEAHRDTITYPGSTKQAKLFARLYEPIWNPDGTVNFDNYYARYVYRLLQTYGSQVRFWEVVNEPDFANGADVSAWLTRAPTPAEQLNTRAPFYHYVRMLRITYEIVKKYRPDAYVTTSVGYPEYVDALLRYTDNPDQGLPTDAYPRTAGAYFDVLSYHTYPNYSLHYWDGAVNAMRYRRSSDYAAERVIENKNQMAAVLAKYGYDGTLHPAKLFTLTESNVSRRTSGTRTGSDEAQRNFGIKSLVLTQKNAIRQFYYYSIGESVDAPAPGVSVSGGDELGLMGLYENLNRATPTTTKQTQLGQAFQTTSQLLYGYQYDAARTTALALPTEVNGAAFGKDGSYVYVLWAKALTDNSEEASASYRFPAAWRVDSVQRREWDYALTGAAPRQSAAQALPLTGVPAFFTTIVTPDCAATGSLLREQWNDVPGSTISSIPLKFEPSSRSALTQFEALTGQDHNYGARLRGYVCPPLSGAYTFFIAGDDQSELWLSTDEDPANRVRLASCTGWTASARDYTRYPSQRSAPVNLLAGRRYYIEALHKQGWGPGYVSVAMRLPDGSTEAPVAGSRLSPFVVVATSPPPPPPTPDTCTATGTLLHEQWNGVSGSTVASIPLGTAPSTTVALTQFESPAGLGANYGARLRGYVCPPLSGAYTFFIAGDDQSELWLSTDEDPANRVRLAASTSWTSSARDYTRYASQRSAPINLVAGRRYYIEALHKQGWGPGYVSVAMRLPDGSFEGPIAGSRLAPYPLAAPAVAAQASVQASASLRGAAGEAATATATATELTAFPNPFSRQATVQFRLAAAGPATLSVYDVRGQLVRQLFQGTGAAGAVQRLSLDGQGLSQGIYVLRLVTGQQVLTHKLVLNK